MLNRLRWLCLLLPGFLVITLSARAQTAANATLSPPQTEAFPRITTFLDVHDGQGQFLHGLQAAELQVLENGQPLPVLELTQHRPGVQVVVTMNPGPAFAIRDSQGISRYDLLVESMRVWASSRQGSTIDDLSLLAAGGPEITHVSDVMDWIAVLESYQPDARASVPGVDILLQALDLAADPAPRPGMERTILFITAPIQGDVTFGLQNLAAQAAEQNVNIHVWLVGSPDVFSTPAVIQMQELASQTGGQFFTFSGVEAIPAFESYLEPLRDMYRLTYESKISSGGTHQLAVEIRHGEELISTPAQSFAFDLQPPDPAFISPTLEIFRKYPSGNQKNLLQNADPSQLSPRTQELQVLIDFPDGHPRPLVRTALHVDGKVVDENTGPPFDQFTWDLSGYTENGLHLLRVEAVDSMGLTGTSIETPFNVQVDPIFQSPLAVLSRQAPMVGGAAVLIAAAILFLALVLGGRLHPHAIGVQGRLRRLRKKARRISRLDTEKVGGQQLENGEDSGTGWVNRLHWPQRRLAPKAFAFLTRLSESDLTADTAVPIPVTAGELTFGSDPHLATLVLDDPSVGALHARLVRKEDGQFKLSDEGSVAGTWINYSPVTGEGAELEHGDLIHLGRVGFRFTQREPLRQRKPVVTLEESPR
jgi:hypothetical protein